MNNHLTPGDIYRLEEHSVDFNSGLIAAIHNDAVDIDKTWNSNHDIEYGDAEQLVGWLNKLSLNLLSQSRTLSHILYYARHNEDWDSEVVKTWPQDIAEALNSLPTQYNVTLDEESGKYLVLAWSPQQGEVVEEVGRVQTEALASSLLSILEQMTYPVEIQQASFDDIAYYKEVSMLSQLINMDRITLQHEAEKQALTQKLWDFMETGKHKKTINHQALDSYLTNKKVLIEMFIGNEEEFNEKLEEAASGIDEYINRVTASLTQSNVKKTALSMKGP